MGVVAGKWDMPGNFDSKAQFAIQMLYERYPGLDIQQYGGMGDYTDYHIRRRGIREFKTLRLSNTELAVISPSVLVNKIEAVINNGEMPSQQVYTEEGKGTSSDSWADEWAKKHEQR